MRLQIVIPVLNLWRRYTLPCLESIRTTAEHRTVVIDNGSVDETEAEARKRICQNFVYHRNGANLGTARVWNDGIRDGFTNGYDFVLVLNNDVLLHSACIDGLLRRATEPDVPGMVTARNVRSECSDPANLPLCDGKRAIPDAESPDFSAFLMTRSCWETVGPFDEGFFPAYFEDNDYHYRMRLSGVRALCHPPAMFYHFGSRTQNESGTKPVVPSSQFEANRRRYVLKWGGPPGRERFREPFSSKINN